MKAIVSTNKTFSKVISSNYRHTNIIDKNGDTKLINVLTTGNQSRINSLSTAGIKIYLFSNQFFSFNPEIKFINNIIIIQTYFI